MSCIFDASALLKGAVKDDQDAGASDARKILPHLAGRLGLRAPHLIGWEVGNVVHHKYPNAFGESPEDRMEVTDLFLREIELDVPSRYHLRRTGELGERHDLTFYDAAYLELAEREDGLLITEDQRLLEAGRNGLGIERSLTVSNAFHHIQDGVL